VGETSQDDFDGFLDEVRVYDLSVPHSPGIRIFHDQEVLCREFPAEQVARTASFDDLDAGTELAEQYQGVRFARFNDGTPTVMERAADDFHGTRVVTTRRCCEGGGGLEITFTSPVSSFGFFLYDLQFEGSFLELFDEQLALIARLDLGDVQGGRTDFDLEWTFFGFSIADTSFGRLRLAFASNDYLLFDELRYSVAGQSMQAVRFIRGDANADGSINIADAVFILNYLFGSGQEPSCLEAADANDDNYFAKPDISDPLYILNWLFSGGPPLSAPQQCGVDPSPCGLGVGCKKFQPCAK
jgi:hypothetical protein